jgi:hypothetical protein
MIYSPPSSVVVEATTTVSVPALPTQSKSTAPELKCPDNNNTRYTAVNGGQQFNVVCDIDYPRNDLEHFNSTVTPNMDECIEHCAYYNKLNSPTSPCVGAVFKPFEGNCWIKRYIGPGNTLNSFITATLV